MELNNIYNTDCLGDKGMCLIPDHSIDLVLCDLPYGTTGANWDKRLPMDSLWAEYKRILKPFGTVILHASEPFTSLLVAHNIEWFKYNLIWVKDNVTGFPMANVRPLKKHEEICVFSPASACSTGKNNMAYNPQGLVPYGKLNKRGSRGGTVTGGKLSNEYVQKFTNYPTTILNFPYDNDKLHPTQKPLALVEYLILTYSNKNDTVLDNCMGSGTVCIAAIRNERNFIGIELNKKYFEIAKERIDAYTNDLHKQDI